MYDEGGEEVFLGRSAAQPAKAMSDETALAIDREVRNIIDECYDKAHQLLEDNRDKLDMMADALMQYETIDAEQIDDIMEGKSPRPPSDWSGDDRGTPPDEGEAESAGNPIGGAATEH
jgi:cell division protease FtsH